MRASLFSLSVHGAGVVVTLAFAGCAGNDEPEYLPPQTLTPAELQQTPPDDIIPGATPQPIETDDDFPDQPASSLIVIEDEKPAPISEQSLFAASQAEKERREEAGPSKVTITNKNLKEYAIGNLSFTEEEENTPTDPAADGGPPLAAELLADETYWRTRIRDVRLDWRESVELVNELEEAASALRTRFYAEDDPFYRDGEIKPAWDRTLDRLAEARTNAVKLEDDVNEILEEGRRAGALPGWLREGLELEPERIQEPNPTEVEHYSIEPKVVDESGGQR